MLICQILHFFKLQNIWNSLICILKHFFHYYAEIEKNQKLANFGYCILFFFVFCIILLNYGKILTIFYEIINFASSLHFEMNAFVGYENFDGWYFAANWHFESYAFIGNEP